MGLDMYANRRIYTKQWEHQSDDEKYTVEVVRGGKPVAGIQLGRISHVEEEVMYWRKANHIHAWFVKNVQDGIDNCAEYYVSPDNLSELHRVCYEVLEASHIVEGKIADDTVARRLLPTTEGFFFGSYGYGNDYLDDVIATLNWCLLMLKDIESGVPYSIYYRSSW